MPTPSSASRTTSSATPNAPMSPGSGGTTISLPVSGVSFRSSQARRIETRPIVVDAAVLIDPGDNAGMIQRLWLPWS